MLKKLLNKDKNAIRKYMINAYSENDTFNQIDSFPQKSRDKRAVACMKQEGRQATINDSDYYGDYYYEQGEALVDMGSFGMTNDKAYELVKKVYGKKKADECVKNDDLWNVYKKTIANQYEEMIYDFNSGKSVLKKVNKPTKKQLKELKKSQKKKGKK